MHIFIFYPLTLDEIYISLIGNPSAQTSRKCTVYNVIPVRLERTANGLKGHCSTN